MAPLLRFQPPAPGPEADEEDRFYDRVVSEGQHYLPVRTGELRDELGVLVPDRAVVPRPVPEDREAWVVVGDTVSAADLVLTGAWASVTY
ncbi:hypothetical protein GCM10010431_72210 [Streptomyces kunmingensis]